MTTNKRRGFGSQVDALLDGPAAPPIAPAAAAPTVAAATDPTAPASSGAAGVRPGASRSSSPARPRRSAAALDVDQVDVDGPRLRASQRSTLAGGDVRRTVYVGADEWRAVLRLAQRRGVTASDVTRAALADYLRRHGGGSSA